MVPQSAEIQHHSGMEPVDLTERLAAGYALPASVMGMSETMGPPPPPPPHPVNESMMLSHHHHQGVLTNYSSMATLVSISHPPAAIMSLGPMSTSHPALPAHDTISMAMSMNSMLEPPLVGPSNLENAVSINTEPLVSASTAHTTISTYAATPVTPFNSVSHEMGHNADGGQNGAAPNSTTTIEQVTSSSPPASTQQLVVMETNNNQTITAIMVTPVGMEAQEESGGLIPVSVNADASDVQHPNTANGTAVPTSQSSSTPEAGQSTTKKDMVTPIGPAIKLKKESSAREKAVEPPNSA